MRRGVCALLCAGVALVAAASAPAGWPDHPENEWVKQSPREGRPPAPTLQYEGGAGYDPRTKQLIHHGGHEGIYQTERTFVYDLETGKWAQRFADTSPPGACCLDGSITFDIANGRLVRFPAGSLGHGFQFSRSVFLKSAPGGVWTYDPATNTWMAMRPLPQSAPPQGRPWAVGGLCAASTYDPAHEVVIHMSDQTPDLHVYDTYANVLERLAGQNPPEKRCHPGLAYDSKRNRVVMFGSAYNNDEKTWFYDYKSGKWEGLDLAPRPPGRIEKGGQYSTHPVMAYDPLNDVMVCIAWIPYTGRYGEHETWVLELSPQPTWRNMNPPAEPDKSMSRGRNFAYSEEHNAFIFELAPTEKGPNQVWTYRYKNPAPAARPQRPAGLEVLTEPNRASLRWMPSPTPGVKEYRVYRGEAERAWQVEYAPVGTAKETSFTDGGLTAGKVYFYKVAALGADGAESNLSLSARTQPRVLIKPVVSVLAKDKVEVAWNPHPAGDVIGYNVYRGLVTVRTVKKGIGQAWRDNDPEYPEPLVSRIAEVTGIRKLNEAAITGTTFADSTVDLSAKGSESADYRYAVYAYIVRAVNRLGTESGLSPYALTIPSEPVNVVLRSTDAGGWELKWDPNPERGITGYRVYKTVGQSGLVERVTPDSVKGTRLEGTGGLRLWVTAVDALGQEGQPSSPANVRASYRGHFEGDWHQ